MLSFHTIADFQQWRRSQPRQSAWFAPTMGALHEGHASLVRHARHLAGPAGLVLSSIFVNPTQFGPTEDFAKYPRTLDADLALLERSGCDAVFVPTAQEMYPALSSSGTTPLAGGEGSTSIDPGPLAALLEGAIRPGHFRGVCTVVAKLLHIVEPSHLLLGQKDFQQQAVLRQMCMDLKFPVAVVTCPTVREADGLAMSSRNRYLAVEDRARAVGLYEALTAATVLYDAGERVAAAIEAAMHAALAMRRLDMQYAVVVHPHTLVPWTTAPHGLIAGPAVLLIAAKLGATRLIDNVLLSERPDKH